MADEMTLIPLVGPADVNAVANAIHQEGYQFPEQIDFAIEPLSADITVSYGASKLLAAGSDVKTGRTSIQVFNYGPCEILVGPSSTSSIYENGTAIPPGVPVTLNVPAEVKLYARSRGYKCKVGITEK